MRSGEKQVLKYLIETSDKMIPLMSKTFQEMKKELKLPNSFTDDQLDYIKNQLMQILPKGEN